MKRITSFLAYILLAVNGLFALLFLLTAYSTYINPVEHPTKSCLGLTFPIFLAIICLFLCFWIVVRIRFALLSVITLLVAHPQILLYMPINFNSSKPDAGVIKVLSYNTMSLGGTTNNPDGSPVLQYILNNEANIVCLQEYSSSISKRTSNKKLMADINKRYKYSSFDKVGKTKSNEIAIFSEYPILSSRRIALDSQYNGATLYKLKVGSDTLYVINCHLESNKLVMEDKVVYEQMLKDPNKQSIKKGLPQLLKKLGEAAAIRAKQADIISQEIEQLPKNSYILVAGDFNDTPISYTHRVISNEMRDAFVESGNGLGISYNQHKLYFRIDHILTSQNIESYDCVVDRWDKVSDHYPISCYISLDTK